MKKILAIALPILLIIGAMVMLYIFVLEDLLDPPPDKVMERTIESASELVNSQTETNETAFVENFSLRSRREFQREWDALSLDGSRRGSWYELAAGLLQMDGSRPEVVGLVEAGEGEGEEEGGEEGEEEAESELEATVRIKLNRIERDIPFVREEGEWRINIRPQPAPWRGGAVPGG